MRIRNDIICILFFSNPRFWYLSTTRSRGSGLSRAQAHSGLGSRLALEIWQAWALESRARTSLSLIALASSCNYASSFLEDLEWQRHRWLQFLVRQWNKHFRVTTAHMNKFSPLSLVTGRSEHLSRWTIAVICHIPWTIDRNSTVDYRMKAEKDKIGPTARRMKGNNKNEEYIPRFQGLRCIAHARTAFGYSNNQTSLAQWERTPTWSGIFQP